MLVLRWTSTLTPRQKKWKEILIFKDRFTCASLIKSPQMHQVYTTGQDLLFKDVGAPWMRPLFSTPGLLHPREGCRGLKGQSRVRGWEWAGVEGARARDHSGALQGQPQGHSLSNLRFTRFSGYLFRCYFCTVSRKINTRIPT